MEGLNLLTVHLQLRLETKLSQFESMLVILFFCNTTLHSAVNLWIDSVIWLIGMHRGDSSESAA